MSQPPRSFIIAVDGPAAAGKGTLARRLAQTLNLAYLDTGKIYRAIAARLLAAGKAPDDIKAALEAAIGIEAVALDDPALGGEPVAAAASKVAVIPAVRKAVLEFQREFALSPPPGPGGKVAGAVLDGRDIGTVVCPDAGAKLFVTASLEARAHRRHKELIDKGVESIYARVLQDMTERDARDSGRSVAPLRAAPDALVIDTTGLDPDAVLAVAMAHIDARRAAGDC